MKEYYKAVALDRTSHYDNKTGWRVGATVRAPETDPAETGPCGKGIHCSPTLLDAVSYQKKSSRYYEVQPLNIIIENKTKARCDAVKVLRELSKQEQDKIAGFKLWETNHPFNPLLHDRKPIDYKTEIQKWDSVRASMRVSMWASVRDSVGASVGNSVWAYVGGLFPDIKEWHYAKDLGPDPWRPLLNLWYAGYLPSFDGETWRLHAGKDAKIVYKYKI